MKASLLLLTLAVGAVGALLLGRSQRREISSPQLARPAAAFLCFTLVIPAGIMAAFARAALWPQFRY